MSLIAAKKSCPYVYVDVGKKKDPRKKKNVIM